MKVPEHIVVHLAIRSGESNLKTVFVSLHNTNISQLGEFSCDFCLINTLFALYGFFPTRSADMYMKLNFRHTLSYFRMHWARFNLSDYDGLEFHVRGNGCKFTVNVQTRDYIKDDLYQAFLITRGAWPFWEKI